jgi:hypothetical protein
MPPPRFLASIYEKEVAVKGQEASRPYSLEFMMKIEAIAVA